MKRFFVLLILLTAAGFLSAQAQLPDISVLNGDTVTVNPFPVTGTNCGYYWVCNIPGIGISTGSGNIPRFKAINNGTTPIVATITATPTASGHVYVGGSNTLIKLKITTGEVESYSVVDYPPGNILISPDGNTAYTVNTDNNFWSITIIDIKSGAVTGDIPIDPYYHIGSLSPDGKRLYLVNAVLVPNSTAYIANVMTVNVKQSSVTSTIRVDSLPRGVIVSPDGARLFVPVLETNSINVIDATLNTVTERIAVNQPTAVTFSADGNRMYVATNGPVIVVRDTYADTVMHNIPMPSGTTFFALSADGYTLYASGGSSGFVYIIDTKTDKLITRIQVGAPVNSITISPDQSQLFIPAGKIIKVIDVAKAALIGSVTLYYDERALAGNFFIPDDSGCMGGSPITFHITVYPTPTLTTTTVTGNILTCAGVPSVSPNIQQFKISGTGLFAGVTATSPYGFEVSLNALNGYGNTVTIPQSGGTINNGAIYVRSSILAPADNISGNVTLTTDGLTTRKIGVTGIVNAAPTVDAIADQILVSNNSADAIAFSGNNHPTFNWVNDTPAIGLAANGMGDIPPFTAINNGTIPIIATITVTPSSSSGCTGKPVKFTITVLPGPTLILGPVTGTIVGCKGTPSSVPNIQQLQVNGYQILSGINVKAPAGFELSLNPNTGYGAVVVFAPVNGTIKGILYIRSAANAAAGAINGTIIFTPYGLASQSAAVSGTINALPTVDQVADQTFVNGNATTVINFTGSTTLFNWTNDTPGIGLPAGGTGDIPSFTAINNTTSTITAIISVTPVSTNGFMCDGKPSSFTIAVNPTPIITIGAVTGNISACQGTASVSPNVQQFGVSGSYLTNSITAIAPSGFEISTNSSNNYGSTLNLVPANGVVNITLYARSAANAPWGVITGDVKVSTLGSIGAKASLSATIHALPVVNAISNQTVSSGKVTNPVYFSGTGSQYNWTNDTPDIGLSASGTGNIPSFITVNNTNSRVSTATITVTPLSVSGCTGVPVSFNIAVGIVLPKVVDIPNAFTPNGDGVNDNWNIKYLQFFTGCTVDVFARNGQRVFSSVGYGIAWDGTTNGRPLPEGSYYYIINLKNGTGQLSGTVTIMR